MDVAVKIPLRQNLTEKERESLRNEIAIMSMNPHPCIVLFMGACTLEGQVKIVTELILDGDLHHLLHSYVFALSLSLSLSLSLPLSLCLFSLFNQIEGTIIIVP